MTPSTRLKAARHALGLTERQMAAALGLRGENAKDDLRKMEDGAREVTGPVLVAAELMVAATAARWWFAGYAANGGKGAEEELERLERVLGGV